MRWPFMPGEQANKTQLTTQADIQARKQARKQQRAKRRSQSRWGWLTDPNNVWVVLAAALAAVLLVEALGAG